MTDVPRRWSPATVASPLGGYSHLAETPAGHRLVFIAGQVGNDLDGSLAGNEVAAQTRQALGNIEALLTAAGVTPANLMSLQSFLVGAHDIPDFRSELTAAYHRWFANGAQGLPGHTLLVVQALAKPELLVEIQGWFTLPPPDESP